MSIQCIVKACEDSWEGTYIPGVANKNNCSGLVKSVAKILNVPLPNGQADVIVTHLDGHWRKLKTGAEAKMQAETGHFVIAGLKSGDHAPARSSGHVVIVVDGPLYREKYPKCWSGSIGTAKSKGDKSVGEIWNIRDRDNVQYYCAHGAVCP